MYFLTSFMVLLRQLRRLYISGSIFQVPLVYNYSTYCTNRVLTRFDTPSTRFRVRFAYASSTLLKRQLRGEVRQYIDYVAHLNRIDSHYYPKEHTILYVFRAPGYNSPVLLSWYKYQDLLLITFIQLYQIAVQSFTNSIVKQTNQDFLSLEQKITISLVKAVSRTNIFYSRSQ